MINHKTVEDYLLSLPNTNREYPFGEGVAVYKVTISTKSEPAAVPQINKKMFALIPEGKTPVNLSLKCDPQLALVLREKYETVLEGYHLNKKHWNTLILSGQLGWEEVQDLIRLSYRLVTLSK
ncbi:MAG: MmcQ/YjbR family DNA-binding protein [bacterium]|nr:MmcQ/YjbR family DNA-binding protein [bacterium]